MKKETFKVSYRDKENNKDIALTPIELDIPETVDEAVELFGAEDLLDYAVKAYVIDKQRVARDANRPDKPKTSSNLSKFKQLSQEKQDELLKAAGLLA